MRNDSVYIPVNAGCAFNKPKGRTETGEWLNVPVLTDSMFFGSVSVQPLHGMACIYHKKEMSRSSF